VTPAPRRALAALCLLLALPAVAGVRARPGGTLRVLLPGEPRELDPARAASAPDLLLARAIGATLYEAGGDGIRPGLAEELPEVAPGGREVRIRLRAGLRFHDGSPLTAADVAESLARLLRPETASPHAGLVAALEGAEAVLAGRAASPSGLQVLSDRELRLLLVRPWPGLARAQRFDGRDLRVTTDLRGVLKGVLGEHLRLPHAVIEQNVFPGSAAVRPLELLRT